MIYVNYQTRQQRDSMVHQNRLGDIGRKPVIITVVGSSDYLNILDMGVQIHHNEEKLTLNSLNIKDERRRRQLVNHMI